MSDRIATAVEHDVDGPMADGRGTVLSPAQAKPWMPGVVEFVSRSDNLRLVYRPAREARNNWGDIVDKREEETVEFANGRYYCEPGQTFTDGTLILDWLRAHPHFNREFAGFVETVPIKPAPTAGELDAITLATVAGDTDALEQLAADEQRGHAREEVLSPIRTALDALERLRAAGESSEGQKGS